MKHRTSTENEDLEDTRSARGRICKKTPTVSRKDTKRVSIYYKKKIYSSNANKETEIGMKKKY